MDPVLNLWYNIMTIKAGQIKTGATDKVSKTTGTTTTPTFMGDSLTSAILNILGTSFKDTIKMIFTKREAKPSSSSPDGHSQRRGSVTIHQPIESSSGEIVMNTARITISRSIDSTTAQTTELLSLAAQVIDDADYEEFWHSLSLN